MRKDLTGGGVAVALVAAAVAVGVWLNRAGVPIHAASAPLYGHWIPHAGPGTPLAVLVAALVIGLGPRLAERLPWRALLTAGYLTAVAWTLALGLVDGWGRGLAHRLTPQAEYLPQVELVGDVGAMLRGFTARILDYQPDSWTTHTAGHPPGALLVFVTLKRIGLGGGDWAAIACVAAGALTAVAVPVTVRALAGAPAGRAAVPFLALFPGAVWLGVSADAIFAGVTATGVALLALAARRRDPGGDALALAGGALLGFGAYLSYGLVLMAPIAVLPALLRRRIRPLIAGCVGALATAAAFTAAGFWWPTGYHLVVQRYYQGIAAERPYAYWVWANLACLVLCAGPAAAPILRRAVTATYGRLTRAIRRRPAVAALRERFTVAALPLAAALVIAAADLSGLSKAEVERIWLPFAVWLPAGAALLPRRHRRGWLIAQAVTALVVNHLVLTVW